ADTVAAGFGQTCRRMVTAGARQAWRFSHGECRKNHRRQREGSRVHTFLSLAPADVWNLFRPLLVGCLEQETSGDRSRPEEAATFGCGHNRLHTNRRSREREGLQSKR